MIPKTTSIPASFHNNDSKKSTLVEPSSNFKVFVGQVKINTFEPANQNISFTEENMPTLHAHLGKFL